MGEDGPVVPFDPFSSSRKASFATTFQDKTLLNMVHYDPLSYDGDFFHLCDNDDLPLDVYDTEPVGCSNRPIVNPQLGFRSWLAEGNLNGDNYSDLVHINPLLPDAAILLGRGTEGADGRIMEFVPTCGCGFILPEYATYLNCASLDRVLCADLNGDNFDEILITRMCGDALVVITNEASNLTSYPCP